jgi:hypothetical protein
MPADMVCAQAIPVAIPNNRAAGINVPREDISFFHSFSESNQVRLTTAA